MQEWLYGKEGYYASERIIGKEGDFYTAVSTSMFFGGAIAKKFLATIESGFLSSSCYVVEIGAHKGYLLADMIQFIYTLKPELLKTVTFVIIEPFEANIVMQKAYFQEAYGNAITLVHLHTLDELRCHEAFFVANEIFDAFSCEVINDEEMLFVDNQTLYFAPMDALTKQKAQEYGITKGELCLGYEAFAASMASCAERFEFVTFDYGDVRDDFSLRVYHKHHVYPFFGLTDFVEDSLREKERFDELFQKSDITYDVNFNHLFYAFEKNGITLQQHCSQMKALVEFGLIELLELFAQNASKKSYEIEMNRIKTLIDPSFMGERFKMACFRKGEMKCN